MPIRILLLEDEPSVQRLVLIPFLRSLDPNMDIEGFENGDDAFRRYREAGPYDLVITDHGHLGLLGIDFIEAIRKIHGHQAIILQTGNIGEHIEAFERKRKDIPLLSKPYRREQLHEFVKRLVPMR